RFHGREGGELDPVPELQRSWNGTSAQSTREPRYDDLHRQQPVWAAVGRRLRDHQSRPQSVSGGDVWDQEALQSEIPVRSELLALEGRGRRLERARPVYRANLQLLRSQPRLRAVRSGYSPQVQLLHLR